jgi:hypothetical protein
MAMEPVRPNAPLEFPSYLRRQWKREHAGILLQEHLAAVIKELQLSHAYKMQTRLVDMHIAMGERITNDIARSDNPLIREALLRSWDNWQRRAEAML